MNQRAMRILIVAENASVRFGGEAILPYHYFRLLLARGVDVHLIVHARTREELNSLFPSESSRLHFVEDLWLQKLFFRIGRILTRRIDEATLGLANQFLTQTRQRKVIRRMAIERCVVHQPIPVSPRTPSLLYGLGVPVVIGPLNGGMEYPPAFRRSESLISRAIVRFGRSCANLVNLLLPGKREAAVLLVANNRTRAALPEGVRGQVMTLPENAVDTQLWKTGTASIEESARFVFIGRLVDWKALDIVLEALRQVPDVSLEVIGDGPMRATWENQALALGVADRVKFHGWLAQAECAQRLGGCCALVLPSLYECGGAVVLEAMAMSRPVIATAWGGPLDYLDESCGILVPPVSRDELISGFSEAMKSLAARPETARRMGEAGRSRLVANFEWQSKIDAMLVVYVDVLNEASVNTAEELVG